MKRRDFMKTGMGVAVTLGPGRRALARERSTPLPRRRYRDGIDLSIIGFGGVVVVGMEQGEANRVVAESFDRGVNYYDVAPSYWDGEAEDKLGKALRPYRKSVFLACKTQKRDARGAREELETSLKRIGVEHFDLYQFHAVAKLEEVDRILGAGGAMETFQKAREDGTIRYIGFSAHSVEAALALLDRHPVDSVLLPVNFVCFQQGSFGPQILQKAKEKGAARLALKALAHAARPEGEPRKTHPKCWYRPVEDNALAETALRFTLSEDVTAAIPPGDEGIYQKALDFAAGFKPLTKEERETLLIQTAGFEPIFRHRA